MLPILKNRCRQMLRLCFVVQTILALVPAQAQSENFDENAVGSYTLPPLLQTEAGKAIRTKSEWEAIQRPLILQKFAANVYGRMPAKPEDFHYKILSVDTKALNGKATRKEVALYFTKGESGQSLLVLLYLPNNTVGRVPVFTGLNFLGNHSVQKDTGIGISPLWKTVYPLDSVVERGKQESRWPVKEIIEAGYGVATAWYQELEQDKPDGWKTGIRASLEQRLRIKPNEWGAVGVWAWGLSRLMDYLEVDDRVDAKRVIITGHSRLGKAALWAAANDRRFAMVVSNNSGEGGAALARRHFGETVYRLNTAFPHWFVDRYKSYNHAVDKLPVDQHMLLALMAPRPLYVASAVEDTWADPKGEFLGAREAGKVYALYGKKGIATAALPPANQPVGNRVMYHLRTGKHDITLYDWQQYLQFASRELQEQRK